jgi:response regulator RpfG family c-di-GMP phosphodiesterase
MSLNILVIDDTEVNTILLEEVCKEEGHNVTSFLNPIEAYESVNENNYDVAFIDYMMPQMDGITLIKKIKDKNPNIICIMVTAANKTDVKLEALEAGASEFLSKPIDIPEIIVRLKNTSKFIEADKLVKNYNKELESDIKKATTKLIDSQYETLAVLSNVAEYRDEDTHNHTKRVSLYSKLIAKHAGLDEETQDILFYASPLHDIGKIGIKDGILLKPGKLTDEEFLEMRTHAKIGYDMLNGFDNKYLKAGAVIALTHHEKFDGSGYPNRLKGDEIDVLGQIVAIADVFDALTSKRPYKEPWPVEKAFKLLEDESGKHFNPFFIQIFLNMKEEVLKIHQNYSD